MNLNSSTNLRIAFNCMNDRNEYIKRVNELDAARRVWLESEWSLSFLRTLEAQPLKQLLDEEILTWHKSNQLSAQN